MVVEVSQLSKWDMLGEICPVSRSSRDAMVVESLFALGTIWMYFKKKEKKKFFILHLEFVCCKLVDTVD